MHTYDANGSAQLQQRARQFKHQVRRFHDGELEADKFQQLRLRNGLYKELHAHMLRVAIPYGVLNSAQLAKLADISRRFDRGYGHFTTRQNIQFNWPQLEEVPDILLALAEVGMHAIQTSGSCMRNITCDHLAGVAVDEIEDPRPWCELIRQWSTLHPEFNWLPRKFKIAVTGAENDRAAIQLHDIGLRLFHDDGGQTRICVYVGGGMGRTPVIGKIIHKDLPQADLLAYLQAILRVYNQYGRRDHRYRSRIKILVNDLGLEVFRARVEKEWRAAAAAAPSVSAAEIAQARACFAPPGFAPPGFAPPGDASGEAEATADVPAGVGDVIPVANPRFLRWRQHNTLAHRDKNRRIVYVSLKAPGQPPGDIDAAQMEGLAALARAYSADELRVSHEQNLLLPYVRREQLFAVWRELERLGLATANIGTLTDMICCPGLDYCALANAGTVPIAEQINARLAALDRLYHIGEVKLKMSGCMNACGHHHAGHIGILGVDKKGSEWYQITLGGSAENHTRLGARLGPAVPRAQVAASIDRILQTYLDLRRNKETFLEAVIRLGIEPFRVSVYEENQAKAGEQHLAA